MTLAEASDSSLRLTSSSGQPRDHLTKPNTRPHTHSHPHSPTGCPSFAPCPHHHQCRRIEWRRVRRIDPACLGAHCCCWRVWMCVSVTASPDSRSPRLGAWATQGVVVRGKQAGRLAGKACGRLAAKTGRQAGRSETRSRSRCRLHVSVRLFSLSLSPSSIPSVCRRRIANVTCCTLKAGSHDRLTGKRMENTDLSGKLLFFFFFLIFSLLLLQLLSPVIHCATDLSYPTLCIN